MKEFHCDECDDEPPFVGTCKLIMPDCASEPFICPVFGDDGSCKWVLFKGEALV